MFTGIVEEIGIVQQIRRNVFSAELTVNAKKAIQDVQRGESIAVNGVCLTVTSMSQSTFTADIMPETMSRSSLGKLNPGNKVNLERALSANGRFGGHIVSGHIDGIGIISSIRKDGNAIWYTVETGMDILRYVIEKGSIAIDGISLTVGKITDSYFSVSVIPHTMQNTCLPEKRIGDIVNLENDCVGKYVEKLMGIKINPLGQQSDTNIYSKITADFIKKNNF